MYTNTYIYIIVYNINNEHLEILLTIPFQGCLDLRQVAHAIMPMCHDSAFATFILKRRVRRVDPALRCHQTGTTGTTGTSPVPSGGFCS